LEEHQIILSLEKKDLKMREAKLADEQARGQYSFEGPDLLAELEELCMRVARVEEEHAVEAWELEVLVIEALNTLIDFGMLPFWEVPQISKKAQEVLKAMGVILECFKEAHASGAGPWD
jgi:hypothetical protein